MTVSWVKACFAFLLILFLFFTLQLTRSSFNQAEKKFAVDIQTLQGVIEIEVLDGGSSNKSSSYDDYQPNETFQMGDWSEGATTLLLNPEHDSLRRLLRLRKSVGVEEDLNSTHKPMLLTTTANLAPQETYQPTTHAQEDRTKLQNETRFEIAIKTITMPENLPTNFAEATPIQLPMPEQGQRNASLELLNKTLSEIYTKMVAAANLTPDVFSTASSTKAAEFDRAVNKTLDLHDPIVTTVANNFEYKFESSYNETTALADDQVEGVRVHGMAIPEQSYIIMTSTCVLAIVAATAILIWIGHRRRALSSRLVLNDEYSHNL